MAEQDPNIQGDGVHEPTPYVTAEMAWEMSKRAAAEARSEALKEAQAQMQNNRETQNNVQTQDNRDFQNNNRSQSGMDYRNDRDDDYDDRRSRKRRRRDDDEEEEDLVGFSPKLVKQLQTTVGVFNTLKDFASNPMQKAIEDRIGGLAAGIIESAFTSPRGPPPKRDMIDTLLNSQMAFGIGQGLGSRAPELVETLSKSFGKEKAEDMIEGMIGKYSGRENREQKKIESGDKDRAEPAEPSRQSPVPQKSDDNIELLLSLDPNNPEHVAAYAESQGGISIDVARKMLMIHQDDIIKRMKSQGADTTVIESQRGSRIGQDNPSQQSTIDKEITPISEPRQSSSVHNVNVAPDYQTTPVQQVPHVQQPPPVQRTQPIQQPSHIQQQSPVKRERPIPIQQDNSGQEDDVQEDTQYTEQSLENMFEDRQRQDQEYAEYKDVGRDRPQERNIDRNTSNNQQAEMMKAFADDIGKVMGDVIGKIEGLNNTVFSLQTELNEIKRQKVQPTPAHPLEKTPLQQQRPDQEFFPEETRESRHTQNSILEDIQEPVHIRDSFPDETLENTHISEQFPDETLKPTHVQESFQDEMLEPTHISEQFPDETQESAHVQESSTERKKRRFARDFFPEDSDREPEETGYTKNVPSETIQNVEESKSEIQYTENPKPNIQDITNFFPEKTQNVHDFERELEEETKRSIQLNKKTNAEEISEIDVKNKDVEIVKRPIISMVNKKRVSYLPKQKDIKKNDSNIGNIVNNEKGEINNNENSDIDKSGKDDIREDINKNNME